MTLTRLTRTIAVVLLLSVVALPAVAEDFWFAAVADTHIVDEESTQIVREAVAMINADERLAFSLWLGDITNRSTAPEFALAKQVLARLERPWHPVRGNHDLKDALYEEHFGPLNRRVDYNGWVFLLFDSNGPRETLVTDETMAWLREQVARIDPQTPVVLAAHHPLLLGGLIPLAGAPEILALFEGRNLKAALAGHLHANQEHLRDGVLFTVNVCCATVRENVDHDPRRGYRVFRCRDGEISTEFVTVREIPVE
ncbi:MAG: metallophosphoesterase family protein [Armatimonadota bacterium]|jgi:predicted phosphodiesterase